MARRKRKDRCTFVPGVPGTGEPSEMYKDLVELTNNRPLANFLYASYLLNGVADAMDKAGFLRNKQRQHGAKSVYKFLDGAKMKGLLNVGEQSKSFGFTDNKGNLINFDAEEAYKKAKDFNDSIKSRVAYVVPAGNKFNVMITEKNSLSLRNAINVEESLAAWSALSNELTSKWGTSMDELTKIDPQLINPGNVTNFLRNLGFLKSVANNTMSVKDIQMLLTLFPNEPLTQNVMARGWGSTEQVAQRLYDILQRASGTTSGQIALASNLISTLKKTLASNLGSIQSNINSDVANAQSTSPHVEIQKTLDFLNKKYGIEREVLKRSDGRITRYSEAVADAIMSLKRQISSLEEKYGRSSEISTLETQMDILLQELQDMQYRSGLLAFLGKASKYAMSVDNILSNIDTTGTELENAHSRAAAVTTATNLQDAYSSIVNTICNSETIANDLNMTQEDINDLKKVAGELKTTLDKQAEKLKDIRREAMVDIGKEFIGEHNPIFGKDLSDIIDMAEADTSILDYLYTVGRSSNTVISMAGAIIRDAQMQRDNKLLNIALEIRRANDVLHKDGKDSAYMYDDKGRIVSQYDWDKYYKERAAYSYYVKDKLGLEYGSADYLAEMDLWEDRNTVDLEVDHENHRFERVPIFQLQKNFQEGWSPAQIEYYNRMMEIKGRIGTLLPAYARHQFIPPQKRASTTQVIKEGLRKRATTGEVTRNILKRTREIFKMKEDDTRFRENGIFFEGDSGIASASAYDNTILKKIPVFYMKKVEDPLDLSKDFSSAVQALASTALNYEAMNSIAGLLDLMQSFVEENPPAARVEGEKAVDVVLRGTTKGVMTVLRKSASDAGVSAMLEGFILKHVYGMEHRMPTKVAVAVGNLIGYNSLKGLSTNTKGALTNKYVGVIQNMIEASGGQYYGMKELLQAEAILLGEQGGSTTGMLLGGAIAEVTGTPALVGAGIGAAVGTAVGAVGMYGKFMDILTNNVNSKDTLISMYFDACQDVFSDLADTRYHDTMFGKLFGHLSPMAMYERGEYWIHMMNVYAVLLREKVVQLDPKTGKRKVISLYNALEKGEKIDGNPELKVKDNIFNLNGKPLTSMSDKYFNAIKRRIRHVNQQCHGSMNKEDKGLVHQYMLGKLAMNFRQWMVEHYSRRFRGLHWDESIRDVDLTNFYTKTKVKLDGKRVKLIDALDMVDAGQGDGSFKWVIKQNATDLKGNTLTDELLDEMLNTYSYDSGWRRGFKVSVWNTINEFIKERREYEITFNMYKEAMTETQKADCKRVLGASLIFLALTALSGAPFGFSGIMGDPDDHEGQAFYRMLMYVIKRCRFDEAAATLPGAIIEGKTIANTALPSAQTVSGLLYPIYGAFGKDPWTTVKSGRYKGWNKYLRNVLKYSVPFWNQIDQTLHMGEEDGIFQVFDNQVTR